jgi:hypothetical protein
VPASPLSGGVYASLRRLEGVVQSELRVEFNPNLQPVWMLRALGEYLGKACDGLRGGVGSVWVERVDPCWDIRADRYRFRLDAGAARVDQLNVTRRGPETEYAGRFMGSKRKLRLYDKGRELVVKGHPDPGCPYTRFEVECWSPFQLVGAFDPAAAAVASEPPGPMRLRDLARLACPLEEGQGVREFVYMPDELADVRYFLLSCAAWQYGTRAGRAAARELLGSHPDAVARAEFVAWPWVEPCPRAAFDRHWAAAVHPVLCALGAVA